MSKSIEEMAFAALSELLSRFAEEGITEADSLGLSLFVVRDPGPTYVGQMSAFAGDLASLGEFAPEWPYALTRDLLEDPTAAYESESETGELPN